MKYLQQFDATLKVISLRLGNLALFVGIAAIFAIPVLLDGLVMRAIRQEMPHGRVPEFITGQNTGEQELFGWGA